ncbi:MAG: stage V sporulation protein AE [Ruminiclostridium sp.]|nr:stage V sporulation protein AE [Ruminiclostridium sp.]
MDYLWAFLAGGALCAVGQLLIDLTSMTPARILVTYVVAGVFLGAVGVYEPFAEFAGAGATVPLTGFGYLLAKGVRDAVTSDGLIGALTGGLEACAGGITAAVIFGLLVALLFTRGDKTAKIAVQP